MPARLDIESKIILVDGSSRLGATAADLHVQSPHAWPVAASAEDLRAPAWRHGATFANPQSTEPALVSPAGLWMIEITHSGQPETTT